MRYLYKNGLSLFVLLFCLFVFFTPASTVKAYTASYIYVEQDFYGQIYVGASYDMRTLNIYGQAQEEFLMPEDNTLMLSFHQSYDYQIKIGDDDTFRQVFSGEFFYFTQPVNIYIRPTPATPQFFEVTFLEPDGINVYQSLLVEKDAAVDQPTAPELEGYRFLGWKDQGNDYFDFDAPITADITLTACFEKVYEVSFYADDNLIISFEVEENQIIAPQLPPEKDGHNFLFWTTDGQTEYDFDTPITEDISLYAKYQGLFVVRFYADDNLIISFEVEENQIIAPQLPPEKEGHNFLYWTTDGQTEYDFDTPITEDISLYAKYQGLFVVRFYADDNLIISFEVEESQTIAPQLPPEKDGHNFLYWTADGQTECDFDTPIIEDIDFYARFERQIFLVMFYLDGDLLEEHSQTVLYMNTANDIDIKEPFYIITRFKLKGEQEAFDFETPISQDLKLYAEKIENFFVITYYDGEICITQKIEKGQPVSDILEPQNDNEEFMGWQEIDSDANYDFSILLENNITLYALYESDLFTIIFNTDGGEVESGELEQKVKNGFSAVLPDNPKKQGHTFIGWDGDYQNVTSDRQIIAIYREDRFQIDFYMYGDKVYQIADIPYNTLLINLFDGQGELQEGDTLLYWKKLSGEIFDIEMPIKENFGLYAEIGKVPITISYHFLEYVYEQTFSYGDTIYPPEPPQPQTGFEFVGWYEEENFINPYVFYSTPTEDITLYGKQQLMTCEVTFVYEIMDDYFQIVKNIDYGQKIEDNIEHEGYSFKWYEDTAFLIEYDFDSLVVEDTILHGLGSQNEYYITIVFPQYIEREEEEVVFNFMEKIALPGYDIYGYIERGYLNEQQEVFNIEYMPAYSFEVYAQFEARKFTLYLDDIYQIEAKYLAEVTLYDYQPPTGYYFDGWLDEDNNFFSVDESYIVQGDMVFSPKLTMIREIIINYLSFSQVYDYGDDVEIAKPQKEGHIFLGWFLDESLTLPFNNKAISEDYEIYLYPKWAKEKYNISIYSEQRQIEVGYGELTPLEIDAEPLEGHTFEGWFFDEDFVTCYQRIVMSEDITLYPKYQIKTFEVTFIGIDERVMCLQTVEYGASAQTPCQRECLEEGYLFDGFEGDYQNITQDTVIQGKYTILFVNKFFDESGNPLDEGLPPIKEGYIFVGWEIVREQGNYLHYPVYMANDSQSQDQPPQESQQEQDEPQEKQSEQEEEGEKIVGTIIFNDPPTQSVDTPSSSLHSSENNLLIHFINRNLHILDLLLVVFTLISAFFSLYLNLNYRHKNQM